MNTPAKISKRIARGRAPLSSSRLLICHNKSAFRNALDGHYAQWSGACVLTAGYRHFFGGGLTMAASYIFNQVLQWALNIGLHTLKNPNKLGHTSREGMVYGFSENESKFYRIWNPKTSRVVESRNVVFHRNTTKSASRDQATLAATRSRVTVVRFQRQYARQQPPFARPHAAECADLRLLSGVRRRHACRNGSVTSASTSLIRRNFA